MTTTIALKTTITVISRQHRIRCTAKVDLPEYGLKAGQRFHLVRMSGTTYKIQAIELVSYTVLDANTIACQVRTNEGKAYSPTLHRNGAHTCNCAAGQNCYHCELAKHTVNALAAERKAAKVAQQQPVIAAPTIPNAERGVLNGNRPFSVLKVA